MSLTSAASFPNGHPTTRSPVSPDKTRRGHRHGLRRLRETILEWRHHSTRPRHDHRRYTRVPKTHQWRLCLSRVRRLDRVLEAAADEVTASPKAARAQQGSAPRLLQAGHQVPVRTPLGHALRDHRESGRSPLHEETRGIGQDPLHHAAAPVGDDETRTKRKQQRKSARQVSPKSST